MTLNYQQVRTQVKQLGMDAPQRERELLAKRRMASSLLAEYAQEIDLVRQKVARAVQAFDSSLRCALPIAESFDAYYSMPILPENASILAADGSQINLDRHAAVQYCLINVGAIQMRYGSLEPPQTHLRSQLYYADDLYSLTDNALALQRDLYERSILAELAPHNPKPVITFTDGPMELWGGQSARGQEISEYQQYLAEYLQVLYELAELGVTTAGYIDKPAANWIVRLLEVIATPEEDLATIKQARPLQGVTDLDLYREILGPGERSAIFGIQSQSAKNYQDRLALHFFYLNVGAAGRPWVARVEIPGWVVANPAMIDQLHAVLVSQSRLMGTRPYPYLLHRAHETALVTLEEKEQVDQMIALELRNRGVHLDGISHKQAAKDLPGRMSYRS